MRHFEIIFKHCDFYENQKDSSLLSKNFLSKGFFYSEENKAERLLLSITLKSKVDRFH